jgi:hypothetical protein
MLLNKLDCNFTKSFTLLIDLKALEEELCEAVMPLLEVYIHDTAITVANEVRN